MTAALTAELAVAATRLKRSDIAHLRSQLARARVHNRRAVPPARPLTASLALPAGVEGCIVQSLSNGPILKQPGGRRAVLPLLHPQEHNLPFGLALELLAADDNPSAAGVSPAELPHSDAPAATTAADRRLLELRYVLGGSGLVQQPGASAELLQAGDTVLCNHGSASVSAAPGGSGRPVWPGLPWRLACLLITMPHSTHAEQRQQQAGGDLRASAALAQVLQQDWLSGQPCGTLPGEAVDSLLLGAHDTARRALAIRTALPAPQHEQHAAAAGHARSTSHLPSHASDSDGSSGSSSFLWLGLAGLLRRTLGSMTARWRTHGAVTKRSLTELQAYELPNQTNRLAPIFDPFGQPLGDGQRPQFIFGVERFERDHRTQPHFHAVGYELFFILTGQGTAFCGDHRFPVHAGDLVVFRPQAIHGIDNAGQSRMYCLEMMLPDDMFAEYVRAGKVTGSLSDDDLCILHGALGCPSA